MIRGNSELVGHASKSRSWGVADTEAEEAGMPTPQREPLRRARKYAADQRSLAGKTYRFR